MGLHVLWERGIGPQPSLRTEEKQQEDAGTAAVARRRREADEGFAQELWVFSWLKILLAAFEVPVQSPTQMHGRQ